MLRIFCCHNFEHNTRPQRCVKYKSNEMVENTEKKEKRHRHQRILNTKQPHRLFIFHHVATVP